MQAVIMAGGKGTRIQTIASDIPKPMISILNKPILEFQIENLKKSGITEITLVIGYLGYVIKNYFGDGSKWNVTITYVQEDEPLGTAGALFYLKGKITDDFILVFGDLLVDLDWNRFMKFHKAKGAIITLLGHPNTHPYDSDVIVVDEDAKVLCIDYKNKNRDTYYHNFVNAGVYCINKKLLDTIKFPEKLDLEKNVISELIPLGNVYADRTTEYVKDMGTPDRMASVVQDIKNGIVTRRNLRNKQKCIFLDRDGTLNVHKGFLKSAEQFELLPNVHDAIKKINSSGYLVIVVTNQPVIARGECSFEELSRIHMKMETELGKHGTYIDDIFFCPHYPQKGYEGEIPELKVDCDCRKPKIGMLTKAADKYNIDLSASWFVGDTTMDIQTGINAGMHTVLIHTGEAGQDGKYSVSPEFESTDLLEAIRRILSTN